MSYNSPMHICATHCNVLSYNIPLHICATRCNVSSYNSPLHICATYILILNLTYILYHLTCIHRSICISDMYMYTQAATFSPLFNHLFKHLFLSGRLILLHHFSDIFCSIIPMVNLTDSYVTTCLRTALISSIKEAVLRKSIQATMVRDKQHGPIIELNRYQV